MLRQSGPYTTDEMLQQAAEQAKHDRYCRVTDTPTSLQGLAARWPHTLLILLLACLPLLTACASPIQTEDNTDPYLRKGINLDIRIINYAYRNVAELSVDGNWAGNMSAATPTSGPRGGNGTVCCFNLSDYTKPVQVRWEWSGINSPSIMGPDGMYLPQTLLLPSIKKEALVKLPQRWPLVVKSDDARERLKSEDSLCVVFRDMNTVELVYGSVGCPTP